MLGHVGKQMRAARIIDPKTRRGFGIAFDHALQLGACPGLNRPEETLEQMVEAGVDAVILPVGSATRYAGRLVRRGGPALILRLDQTTMWRQGSPLAYADGHSRLVAKVADAVALGADAVITYLFVGHNDPDIESRVFEMNAAVNEAAREAGIVHIIETMGARGALAKDVFDPDFVAFHTRIGMEMGADILKTDWPGSAAAMRPIAASLPVPILIAGGARQGSDRDTVALVADVIEGGAAGILFGRSVFQAKNPLAVMKACRAIIHDSLSLGEALEQAGL